MEAEALTDSEREQLAYFEADFADGVFGSRTMDEALRWEADNLRRDMRPHDAAIFDSIREKLVLA